MYDVIMATYNGEKYVVEQLDSIINQTIKPNTVIIRDDCSTDNTVKIINDYIKKYTGDVNFEILDSTKNLGYIKNFEALAKAARSEFVFFCDQDDVWINNKAETFLKRAEEKPNVNLLFSDARLVDDKLQNIGFLWENIKFDPTQELTLPRLFKKSIVTGATMLCRRDFLQSLIPFPENLPHDLWLSTCSTYEGSIDFCNDQLVKYRQHSNNQIGVKRSHFIKKIATPFEPEKIKYRIAHYRNNYLTNESMATFLLGYSNSKEYHEIKSFLIFIGKIYNINFYKCAGKHSFTQSIKAYIKYNDKKNVLFNMIDLIYVHIFGIKKESVNED
ncbi:hypothetical protein C3387_03445 [Leclercia sp. LSNIH6]|nr:hypothetical protein C3370_21425 [Leclercia sp. LSNIH7]POU80017.1 hypothetical protein C3387_03445 [Leclercia sp. LSNIH6]POW50975.1 hypothetical protein C3406_12685 [Leclercia sp. LSNIH8]